MWGAIIGDLAGSIYEFSQIKEITSVEVDRLIPDNAFFSDDTILTVAVLEAVLEDRDYNKYLKMYGEEYIDYKPDFSPYFRTSFSPGYIKWLKSDKVGNSIGNGAMMRISPIGYLFNDLDSVRDEATKATIPSHNSDEAISSAKMIASVIFLARSGYSKNEIIELLDLDISYKPFDKFNTTCSDTIGNCLYAVFTSNSFEESLMKVISFGGDTDTNACIVGSMAEAFYGIEFQLIDDAKKKIPDSFVKVLERGYSVSG